MYSKLLFVLSSVLIVCHVVDCYDPWSEDGLRNWKATPKQKEANKETEEEKLRDGEFYASLFQDSDQTRLTHNDINLLRSGHDLPSKLVEDAFKEQMDNMKKDTTNRGISVDIGSWFRNTSMMIHSFLKEKVETGSGGIFSVFWTVFNQKECTNDTGTFCFSGHADIGCFGENLAHLCTSPHHPNALKSQYHMFRQKVNSPITVTEEPNKNRRFMNELTKNPKKKVAFILHGFDSHSEIEEYVKIRKTLLYHPAYENVVQMDYRNAVPGPDYIQAMANSEVVGRLLGKTLINLTKMKRLNPDQVHIIGFSMGTQVAHFAGEWFYKKTGVKIGRITGLDPPGVLTSRYPKSHLSKEDANFVDVIHTSAGFEDGAQAINSFMARRVGTAQALGHVDFYPNGGGDHPQCGFMDIACKHDQSLIYFLQSIFRCNYFSVSCTDVNVYDTNLYSSCKDAEKGPGARMGLYSSHSSSPGRGKQFLNTIYHPPTYCYEKLNDFTLSNFHLPDFV